MQEYTTLVGSLTVSKEWEDLAQSPKVKVLEARRNNLLNEIEIRQKLLRKLATTTKKIAIECEIKTLQKEARTLYFKIEEILKNA